ncbi:MAG: DUF4136 domain-containing protein [Nannocystaceae bacterium]
MRPLALALALSAVPLAAPACAPRVHHHTEYARDVDFSALRTYAWIRDDGIIAESPDAGYLKDPASAERTIRDDVDHVLQSKGYAKVAPGEADFLVSFAIGMRETEWALGYNAEEFGLVYHARDSELHRKGELAIDLFDRASKAHIWHGSAARKIEPDADLKALVEQAVALILADLPPP